MEARPRCRPDDAAQEAVAALRLECVPAAMRLPAARTLQRREAWDAAPLCRAPEPKRAGARPEIGSNGGYASLLFIGARFAILCAVPPLRASKACWVSRETVSLVKPFSSFGAE